MRFLSKREVPRRGEPILRLTSILHLRVIAKEPRLRATVAISRYVADLLYLKQHHEIATSLAPNALRSSQ